MVLLRTSAVRVRNPNAGKSTLAYAQHDTASQATLISRTLCYELNVETKTDSTVTLRTLSDQTAVTKGRTVIELWRKVFHTKCLCCALFNDDENVLPHAVDTAGLEELQGSKHPDYSRRKVY